MKKRTLLFIAMVLTTGAIIAQVPQQFSYQSIVRNSTNALVVDTEIGLKVSILHGATEVYSEVLNPTTNQNGLLSVMIGSEPGFELIDWSLGNFFIQTEIDIEGGTDYTITGTSQILSVPFAMYAASADETDPVFNASDAAEITSSDILSWNNKLDAETQNLEDVLNNGFEANSRIAELKDPIHDYDATNKNYVDSLISNLMLDIYSEIGVTDIEGNHYGAVRIGNQVWMTENLKTSKLNNGLSIDLVEDPSDWQNYSDAGYCYFYNDEATHKDTYGALYNFYAVNTGNLCPAGWNLPTQQDWETLISHLGGETSAGGVLKETGFTFWATPNTGATNSVGFNARGTGNRNPTNGDFEFDGEQASFWTSTAFSPQLSKSVELFYDSAEINVLNAVKKLGASIRCVKY
jgi:uncharacterized protein (TIGR02145 family)